MSSTRSTTKISREAALEAALRVADREGLSGLTMRALAGELGVPVMNLYHYVSNKDDVLDAIADLALAEMGPSRDDGPWHERLADLMQSFHDTLLRHPSLGQLLADRPVSGPHTYRSADATLALLLEAGFEPAEAVDAFTALITYTIGSSLFQISRRNPRAPEAAEQARLERLAAADPDALPALTTVADHMRVRGTDAQFAYGLRLLLDGLARR